MSVMASDIVHTQLGALPATDLRLNLVGVYTDADEATVVVRWYGQERGLPVSLESAATILSQAQHDAAVVDSDGYDDDPTAAFYWLRIPNEYARLLTNGERAAVAAFQEEVTPRRQTPKTPRHLLTGQFRARR